MENVRSTISEIKDNLNQRSASRKDEIAVMKAMLNDPTYQVGIYDKTGKIGDYSPYADSRKMLASVISSTTKISQQEAQELANAHELSKNEAASFVNISKEFANTYIQTGRKLPLGGRKTMSVFLELKHVEEREKVVPSAQKDKEKKTTIVPAHDAIKAKCPCPEWIK